jgi:hypothetical protein
MSAMLYSTTRARPTAGPHPNAPPEHAVWAGERRRFGRSKRARPWLALGGGATAGEVRVEY